MITDRTLHAYEQFCDNYEDYSAGAITYIPLSKALTGISATAALGLGGMGLGAHEAKRMAEDSFTGGAILGGVGGTLAGAGLVGAGALVHKLLKKRKKKKPFNS